MTKANPPRSPYERLGGYVHLPRLIDKARLARRGQLHGYNYKLLGFDRQLLTFLGVDGEEFEDKANEFQADDDVLDWIALNGRRHTPDEIAAWSQSMIENRPDTPDKLARFRRILAELGGNENSGVATYFDLIDFEERRDLFLSRYAAPLG